MQTAGIASKLVVKLCMTQSIISVLKAAAPEWEFEQINFVVGNRRSVVESDFYTKLKKA